jgi:hypothetical protein
MQSRRDGKVARRRDAGANRIGSHAGAWEPEKTDGASCKLASTNVFFVGWAILPTIHLSPGVSL